MISTESPAGERFAKTAASYTQCAASKPVQKHFCEKDCSQRGHKSEALQACLSFAVQVTVIEN